MEVGRAVSRILPDLVRKANRVAATMVAAIPIIE
jgi:hypothetical protein